MAKTLKRAAAFTALARALSAGARGGPSLGTRLAALPRMIAATSRGHYDGGLRLALGICIIMVVAAEMQLSKYGVGARLIHSGQVLETGQVFAMLVLLAIVGVLLTKGQDKLDRMVGRWRTR